MIVCLRRPFHFTARFDRCLQDGQFRLLQFTSQVIPSSSFLSVGRGMVVQLTVGRSIRR
jgi:hypothetical protein